MSRDVPVGIMFPYNRGKSGYFQQTFSDIERAHTNLKMLLMTAKGERPMMPTYGSDLRSLLFNPGESEYDTLFVDAVHEAADKWMPEIAIISVAVDRETSTAPNSAILYITFSILSIPDSREELELEIS
tara:strand:- start:331 stop:717 length:387 start_codon:yes stop_codon:yes gene_type:complete